jgi:hypothetical protein
MQFDIVSQLYVYDFAQYLAWVLEAWVLSMGFKHVVCNCSAVAV